MGPISMIMMSILFYPSIGQKNNSCELLAALLKHEEARKVFYFNKHTEVPIVFVDVHYYFKDCTITNYYGREVKIVHDSSYLEQVNYSNIIINILPQTGRTHKISAYYKMRNAIFKVNFKRRNGKIVITKIEGGYY
jgi:hypothetical protein